MWRDFTEELVARGRFEHTVGSWPDFRSAGLSVEAYEPAGMTWLPHLAKIGSVLCRLLPFWISLFLKEEDNRGRTRRFLISSAQCQPLRRFRVSSSPCISWTAPKGGEQSFAIQVTLSCEKPTRTTPTVFRDCVSHTGLHSSAVQQHL